MIASWQESYDKPRQYVEKQRHHSADKSLNSIVKAMVFSVVTYGCDSWTIKKAECQRIDYFKLVLGKTPESPLDLQSKEIRPVNLKENQP